MNVAASILAGLALTMNSSGDGSMDTQTIAGEILDNRITACGVKIGGDAMATVMPFIEGASELSGNFRINVKKQSRSGTSMSSQANAFRGGTLGNMVLAVDRPSKVTIEMTVANSDGQPLCRLAREIQLDEPSIRL